MGLEPTIVRSAYRLSDKRQALRIGYYGAVPNRQFDHDHRNDIAFVLDRDFVSLKLRKTQEAYGHYKEEAALYGGPACLETFGEEAFIPEKALSASLSENAQKLYVSMQNRAGQITNRYIPGDEQIGRAHVCTPVTQ